MENQDLFTNLMNPQERPLIDLSMTPEHREGKRVAVIRTSDRIAFKACRRKWNWSSHMRDNLQPQSQASPLWFGTGFHFALEDWHGYRKFSTPMEALTAFVEAYKKFRPESMPDDWRETYQMGLEMFRYYLVWYDRRKHKMPKTLVIDGVPQVEVNFRIKLPLDQDYVESCGFDEVVYSGTIDRVVRMPDTGLLWTLDYKTAKRFSTGHFITDPQITVYNWAARDMYSEYGHVAGMIYAQHLKASPTIPQPLKSGGLSVAANQAVSHITYKAGIEQAYGSYDAAPEKVKDYLSLLARSESDWADRFVRYDFVNRNDSQMNAEGARILLEAADMINPKLPLYSNPTRECQTFCSFTSPCVSLDDGSDWRDELRMNYMLRDSSYDRWRNHLEWPDDRQDKAGYESVDWDNV